MNTDVFRELLTLALHETCFVFDGKLYKQCDGVSMGSPLGPLLANAFLVYHESEWIKNCPEDIKPIKYIRYVDDIFLLCRSQDHHKKFMDYMNSRHPNITFTDEIESNNTMAFLDVEITRIDNAFSTNLFRKHTFSGVFTNFFSFISIQYKAGLIGTLLFRCFQITSSTDLFHDEVERLRGILYKNAYPVEFIDQCITLFLNKRYKLPVATVDKRKVTIVLPYLGKLSLEIRNRLRKIINTHVSNCSLMVIFKTRRRLKNMFRFKDTLPQPLQSYVIYRYTCGTCNSSYIGKTERHCHVRWCEHLKITPLRGRASKKKCKPTAVREHTVQTEHIASLDDFEIIGRENTRNDFKLRIEESLLIKKYRPKLNENVQSTPLMLF